MNTTPGGPFSTPRRPAGTAGKEKIAKFALLFFLLRCCLGFLVFWHLMSSHLIPPLRRWVDLGGTDLPQPPLQKRARVGEES